MVRDIPCPDCGHTLDTPRTNDALADDPDNDFFCDYCGGLFTEGDVFVGAGKPWAVVVGNATLEMYEEQADAQETVRELHAEGEVPRDVIEVQYRRDT